MRTTSFTIFHGGCRCAPLAAAALLFALSACHDEAGDRNSEATLRAPATSMRAPAAIDSVIVSSMPSYRPQLALPTLGGDSLRLTTYAGRPVLVHFWAPWCPPCRRMIPDLTRVHASGRSAVIAVLPRGPAPPDDMWEDAPPPYPVAIDDGGAAESFGGVYSLPTTFVVGADGNVRRRIVGPASPGQLLRVE